MQGTDLTIENFVRAVLEGQRDALACPACSETGSEASATAERSITGESHDAPKDATAELPMAPIVCRGCGHVTEFRAWEFEHNGKTGLHVKRVRG